MEICTLIWSQRISGFGILERLSPKTADRLPWSEYIKQDKACSAQPRRLHAAETEAEVFCINLEHDPPSFIKLVQMKPCCANARIELRAKSLLTTTNNSSSIDGRSDKCFVVSSFQVRCRQSRHAKSSRMASFADF